MAAAPSPSIDTQNPLGRMRTMPLIPEPLELHRKPRDNPKVRSGKFQTRKICCFFPELKIAEYLLHLGEDKRLSIERRASTLSFHSTQNRMEEVSESSWEADVRNDVFGEIRADLKLRIDKRPYQYKKQDGSVLSIQMRTPDATMGLRTMLDKLSAEFLDNNGGEHLTKALSLHPCLSKERLHLQADWGPCGLVVDGKWGRADLIFPWAVYEAKKDSELFEQAEDQVIEAAQTYLAMLDDLARVPGNVQQYQFPDSSKSQIFCFTLSASEWKVYIAYHKQGLCQMETIWEGDVCKKSGAAELIAIVDQIQDWAVTHHRDFVTKHLEAWFDHREKTLYELAEKQSARAREFDPTCKRELTDAEVIEAIIAPLQPMFAPGWHQLKIFLSKKFESHGWQSLEECAPVDAAPFIIKGPRGRGRPRKRKPGTLTTVQRVKRGRGRPRKTIL